MKFVGTMGGYHQNDSRILPAMKHVSEPGYWARVVGLPVLLVLLTVFVLGSHYETNDDFAITLLLRGRTAAAPVTDLHLYFHGWAGLLARLYQLAPAVPWYGLLLYLLLTLALVLLTAVLERLLVPHLRPWPRAGLLAAFLVLASLEHAQWFNYLRVPLLLAGAAVLWAAQRYPARRWVLPLSLVLFAAAWAIRPSAAVLGAAVVAPAAWWLGGRAAGRVLAGVAAVALLLGLTVQLTRSPEAARYRRLDVLKSEVLDYGWRVPTPRTRPDSLGVQAVQEWSFGDSTLVNEAFFERAYQASPLGTVVLDKAGQLRQVLRDYFPLLLLHVLLLIAGRRLPAAPRRWQRLYVLGTLVLLCGLALGLKLPPRLAGPLLTLSVVAHVGLVYRARQPVSLSRLSYVLLLLAAGMYMVKVGHRRQTLLVEQRLAEAWLKPLCNVPVDTRVVVGIDLEGAFKGLSPFQQYVPATGPPWLLLTGWPTLDPSQARLRQQLTGRRAQPEALRRLRRQPGVRWLNVDAPPPRKL